MANKSFSHVLSFWMKMKNVNFLKNLYFIKRNARGVTVIIEELDLTIQVQILNKAVNISQSANTRVSPQLRVNSKRD